MLNNLPANTLLQTQFDFSTNWDIAATSITVFLPSLNQQFFHTKTKISYIRQPSVAQYAITLVTAKERDPIDPPPYFMANGLIAPVDLFFAKTPANKHLLKSALTFLSKTQPIAELKLQQNNCAIFAALTFAHESHCDPKQNKLFHKIKSRLASHIITSTYHNLLLLSSVFSNAFIFPYTLETHKNDYKKSAIFYSTHAPKSPQLPF